MDYKLHKVGGIGIAEINESGVLIQGTSDMLDIMANVPTRKIIIKKEMLDETFFDLRSGLAGEILQKASNYRLQVAIVGDFSKYRSQSLRDFIYESNHSNQVVFVDTVESALKRLAE